MGTTRLAGVFSILLAFVASGARAQEPPLRVLVFDSFMTPAAGAQTVLAIQHVVASAEDRWLPRKIGQERTGTALALGILYRTGKFIALDLPQDHFLMVAAHEVFGHGARFRELGEGRIRYGFDAPIPYGPGEAFTSFRGEFPVTPIASLNVSASGIEAQHALADAIADTAAARGRIHYRQAWLYFESRLAAMSYILSASPHSEPGHDVADYLDAFEEACTQPCTPPTRKYLRRRALVALADPLLYYSLYGFAASYIGGGKTTAPLPMIPVGSDTRILPSLGFALAPYGTEWVVRTALASGQRDEGRGQSAPAVRLSSVTLRIGNTGASTTWGVSVRASDVARVRGVRVNAAVDVWRQPPVLADQTSDPQKAGVGATATLVLPLPRPLRSEWSRGLHVTAGYKSEGYIPGEQLSGGLVLRVGMQIR